MRKAIQAAWLVAVSACYACGGAEPAPVYTPPPRPEPQKAVPVVARTSSELGTIDPAAVKRAFGALDDKFIDCQKRALDRVEVLAGNVKFFLRVGADGSAKWVYLEESEVGDRDTEKCLVDVVMSARWPKPDAGDAEARYSMELPLQATRPPNSWSPDKVAGALGKSGEMLDKCKTGASAKFHATVYVGTGGRVMAAGVAMSNKDGEETADCLAKALVKMKGLPSPGSWPAKVSFGL
jgi:hypothetical protein